MDTPSSLHVPISSSLKSSARVAAAKLGFSSIQEYIRVHLTKLVAEQEQGSHTKNEIPEKQLPDPEGWRF